MTLINIALVHRIVGEVEEIQYLGACVFDKNLTWKSHIKNIVKKKFTSRWEFKETFYLPMSCY